MRSICVRSQACAGRGSTTSILLNIPAESVLVVTTMDGHQMAKQGRAGPALAFAAIGWFVAGTAGGVLLMLIPPFVAAWALKFGSALPSSRSSPR